MTPTLTRTITQTKPLIAHYEQAECPGCDSVIRPAHVFRAMGKKEPYELPKRTVTAYCVACDAGWCVKQVLRGGVWSNETDVTRMTDTRQLTGLQTRVGKVDGDIRHEALVG